VSASGPILVAAGGTGGHLFAAEALAIALRAEGATVHLATDERALKYGGSFPAEAIHTIPSATLKSKSPVAVGKTAIALLHGFLRSLALMRQIKPAAVVGFGGYPTVPPLLAASVLRIPTLIHEQNGVIGRANALLAPRVTAIGTGFAAVKGIEGALQAKARHVGNPVRPAVLDAVAPYWPPREDAAFRLLVTGGSQGARVMSDIVPEAVTRLPDHLKRRLSIVQQARAEDLERVRQAYAACGVSAEVEPFFGDLPARIADAHLVIGRSGASTVAELAVIGRPSILVPLPHALDQDQAANAATLGRIGAAIVVTQAAFTPDWLAERLKALMEDEKTLTDSAEAARSAGIPDAAARFAALVLEIAGGIHA
jgi:UDP-N-acetylglucosamine--N-acetylmuramyl-(pentapeptide) pyrophosphoryl-undecaprenol N-acetylglucosamine transferase